MVEVALNNFKAFVMFALKKLEAYWSKNFESAYVSPENFFWLCLC
jgi:hypothetical protein